MTLLPLAWASLWNRRGTAALVVLSSMNPDEFRSAVIGEDVASIRRVKGIGPKTAQRIILDLKDKMMKDSGDLPLVTSPVNNTLRGEALSALVALGFQRIRVQKVLNSILKKPDGINSVEDLIKTALKQLS